MTHVPTKTYDNLEDVPALANGLTPLLSRHLGSQALAEHRATLFVELEVLAKKFDRFGWDRDRGSVAHDRLCMDWMNALQDYPLAEVQQACAAAVLANPNRMPNEGHVRSQIISARSAQVLRKEPKVEPKQMPTEAEKARIAQVLADAGYAPKRMDGAA